MAYGYRGWALKVAYAQIAFCTESARARARAHITCIEMLRTALAERHQLYLLRFRGMGNEMKMCDNKNIFLFSLNLKSIHWARLAQRCAAVDVFGRIESLNRWLKEKLEVLRLLLRVYILFECSQRMQSAIDRYHIAGSPLTACSRHSSRALALCILFTFHLFVSFYYSWILTCILFF